MGAASDDNVFTITELTGERRVVELRTRGLPYRPFSLRNRQRVEVTWYPGNPVGVATVLGSTKEPTKLTGAWKDIFIGDTSAEPCITKSGEAVLTVEDADTMMESLVNDGQMLEVTWNGKTRRGLLTEWDPDYQTRHDIDWAMAFSWVSAGDDQPLAVVGARGSAPLVDTANGLALEEDKVKAALASPPVGYAPTFLDGINTVLERVTEAREQALNITASVYASALPSADAGRRMAAVLTASVLAASDGLNALHAPVPDLACRRLSMGERLAFSAHVRGAVAAFRHLRGFAAIRRADLRELKQAPRAHTSRDGEDLRTIAGLYYGDPFAWRRLLLFNNLDTEVLVPGQVVLVPEDPEAPT